MSIKEGIREITPLCAGHPTIFFSPKSKKKKNPCLWEVLHSPSPNIVIFLLHLVLYSPFSLSVSVNGNNWNLGRNYTPLFSSSEEFQMSSLTLKPSLLHHSSSLVLVSCRSHHQSFSSSFSFQRKQPTFNGRLVLRAHSSDSSQSSSTNNNSNTSNSSDSIHPNGTLVTPLPHHIYLLYAALNKYIANCKEVGRCELGHLVSVLYNKQFFFFWRGSL